MDIFVFPKVYGTAKDTELLAKTVKIGKNEQFLEIGTGTGAVSLHLSKKAQSGLAVDINPWAVKNARFNAKHLGIRNVSFALSDLFSSVKRKYDVILFNPPYSSYISRDVTDRMFWDTENKSKAEFFLQAKKYLKPGGMLYFGWANFKDLDIDLPIRLAKKEGFRITKVTKSRSGERFEFYVFEMKLPINYG